ncbi:MULTISPECIES: alpha/beta hydrolase family protein [Actinomadura]|uniref:Serine aminopeptidase S33 domain-containing protein n=1 Tax=Actinomadura miaoliensis TaxID=430685 RepID=A0ABP7UXD8_9ACTN
MLAPLRYPIRQFRRFAYPEPGADFEDPADYGLEPESFEVVTTDGVRCRGWLFTPKEPWGVVIICHARSAGKSRTLRQARLLWERGLAVATFDFRGCGDSAAPPRRARRSLRAPLRDLEAVARHVCRRFAADPRTSGRVALLGCSFGGNMVIAHAGHADRTYPAIMLDSTPLVHWADMLGALLARERRDARFPRARAVADRLVICSVVAWTRAEALYRHARRSVRRLARTKALLVIGTRDTLFDVEESHRFLSAYYAGDTETWRVPRGRHLTNHVVDPEAYAARIVTFLASAFEEAERRPQSGEINAGI